MRRDLLSAELCIHPCVISRDSRTIRALCGGHLLTCNLKSGRILSSTECVVDKASNMVSKDQSVIISGDSQSRIVSLSKGDEFDVSTLSGLEAVAASPDMTVFVKRSSEECDMVLCYVQGNDLNETRVTTLYRGPVGPVECTNSTIAFVSGLNRRSLVVFDIATKSKKELVHNRPLTCVAIHPTELQVSAGDADGRILRWFGDSQTPSTTHHWHSVPVAALRYSASGSMLLSGAEEGVLCLWTEASSSSKPQFIPRLGGPITHLCVSGCNQYVAVSIKSNKIVVVDLFTRAIQSVINGALTETDGGRSKVSPISSTDLVSVSTRSHVQIFNLETRSAVTKNPHSIQDRNYIPASLRAKVNAQPYECKHVRVVPASQEGEAWYMMASLERRVKSGKTVQMIKVFSSTNKGSTWTLHTLCMNAHQGSIISIAWSETQSGFLTASKDGSVKVWKLENDTWTATARLEFKNKTPSFLSVGKEGLIIIGFGDCVTLWDPSSLRELTRTGLQLDIEVVFAGLVEDSEDGRIDMYALSRSGQVTLWDLKRLTIIKSSQIEVGISEEPVATVFGNRLLVSGSEGSIVSVSENPKGLKAETISVCAPNPVESLFQTESGLVVSSNLGRKIYRISLDGKDKETNELGPLESVDKEADIDMESEDGDTSAETPQNTNSEAGHIPKIRAPTITKGVITKLFPLENSLDSIGSPEEQFLRLIGALAHK
jgi:WD40 repeat protein